MADWSQLPQEILFLIAKGLETRFDVLRFRSVCSSWRSSFPRKVYPLPKYLPSKEGGLCDCFFHRIIVNTCYLVRLPGANQTAPACWLVNIRDDAELGKMHLLKPLSESELNPLPVNFPKVLDLTNFQVIELGHQFVVQYTVFMEPPFEPEPWDDTGKVAFLWSSTNSDDFVMLALSRVLAGFLRPGEMEWILDEHGIAIQDIISFDGKFYAMEQTGRTMVVDQYLNVSFLDHVGSPTSRKFLVQSGDNLLTVEMFYPTNSNPDDAVGFRIFRLDEEELKWVEMESLGNQILFLRSCQAIAASASEFYWGKGNLIFYSTDCIPPGYGNSEDGQMIVFDLDTGTTSPLEDCPAYCNLFWPPPEWITSSESVISPR